MRWSMYTERLIRHSGDDEFVARQMTEAVARVLQGAELLRHSTQNVVDVFLTTRVPNGTGSWGSHYGTLALPVNQADGTHDYAPGRGRRLTIRRRRQAAAGAVTRFRRE